MCQVSTVRGVLYLILIVYYMNNLSKEELSITFHMNPITTLVRYIYCSKAKENATNVYLFTIKVFHLQKKILNSHFN